MKTPSLETRGARLLFTQIEVGCPDRRGRPSYKWVDAWTVIGPEGEQYAPPMRKREAVKFCKDHGWTIQNGRERRCPGCGSFEWIHDDHAVCDNCTL